MAAGEAIRRRVSSKMHKSGEGMGYGSYGSGRLRISDEDDKTEDPSFTNRLSSSSNARSKSISRASFCTRPARRASQLEDMHIASTEDMANLTATVGTIQESLRELQTADKRKDEALGSLLRDMEQVVSMLKDGQSNLTSLSATTG
eukprot:2235545-Prymnesium_polylepis.1